MKMVGITATLLLISLLVVGCGGLTSTPSAKQTPPSGTANNVLIKNFSFSPKDITTKVGETVTWTNEDSAKHTVTGSDWGSGDLAQGQTYSKTFDKAGAYEYRCNFHPSMVGSVIVK